MGEVCHDFAGNGAYQIVADPLKLGLAYIVAIWRWFVNDPQQIVTMCRNNHNRTSNAVTGPQTYGVLRSNTKLSVQWNGTVKFPVPDIKGASFGRFRTKYLHDHVF